MSGADEPRTTEYWKTALVIARNVIDDSGLLSQADEYAAWQLGAGSEALEPETGWFREGLTNGQRVWMRDPVKGRAGVMFHKVREGL